MVASVFGDAALDTATASILADWNGWFFAEHKREDPAKSPPGMLIVHSLAPRGRTGLAGQLHLQLHRAPIRRRRDSGGLGIAWSSSIHTPSAHREFNQNRRESYNCYQYCSRIPHIWYCANSSTFIRLIFVLSTFLWACRANKCHLIKHIRLRRINSSKFLFFFGAAAVRVTFTIGRNVRRRPIVRKLVCEHKFLRSQLSQIAYSLRIAFYWTKSSGFHAYA